MIRYLGNTIRKEYKDLKIEYSIYLLYFTLHVIQYFGQRKCCG